MVTSARFQILSGWASPLPVTAHVENLQEEFPTPLVAAPANPTPTIPVDLSADYLLHQSWVGLDFKSSSIGINLGRGAFEAGIRHLDGPPGQATAIVAPTDPLKFCGWDFFIWVLAGPGKLQSVLNSIIRANTAPFLDFVKEQVPKLDVGVVSLKVTSIDSDQLECSFVSVSKQGRRTPWIMDLVLNFSGLVRAEWTLGGAKFHADLKIKNLAVQLGVTIDTRKSPDEKPQVPDSPDEKPRVPDIHLHRLQCSVDNLESLPLLGYPGSYYLPGLVNTTYNEEVRKAINDKLKEKLPKLGSFRPLEKYNLSKIPKTLPSPSNFQEWMSKPSIQAKRLSQLKIPGTHDSAAYTFDKKISHILYDGLRKLLNLRRDEKAPPGHKLDDLSNIYIGPEAYDSLLDNIALLGQAHHESKTIKRQLEDGIRFLDLRIYLDKEENDYYTQHLLRAPKLRDLIAQIREYLDQHRSSQEFIIVEFAQSWFPGDVVSDDATKVADLVKRELGPWLYMPADAPSRPDKGLQRYNFQSLASIQLSSITEGNPKVLFVSRDSCIYPHSVLNVDGSLQDPPKGSPLSPYWFTKVPSNEDVVGHILLNTFDPSARIKVLQRVAYESNATAKEKIAKPFWRYMMDWYTESESKELPVDLIIKAND